MLWRSDTTTPTLYVRRWTRLLATALARYPSSSAADMTAWRLASLTAASPRTTRETTDLETPARAATSRIVGGRDPPARLRPPDRPLDIGGWRHILAGTFPLGTF